MPDKFLGSTSELANQSVTIDPSRGISSTQIYNGSLAEMQKLQNSLGSDVISILDDSTSPVWRLIIQTPDRAGSLTSTTSVNHYELIPNLLQRDGRLSPRAAALGAVTTQRIMRLLDAREVAPNDLRGDALKFYKTCAGGATTFNEQRFVFRFTKIVSPRYTIKMAFSKIGLVYTTSQVKAEVQPPSSILFSLDDIKADSSVGGPADIAETGTELGILYGWMKGAPACQTLAGGKFAITQDFEQVAAASFYHKRA